MENAELMTQAIRKTAIKATTAVVQVISEADLTERKSGAAAVGNTSVRMSEPSLKQPMFIRKPRIGIMNC